MAILDEQAVEVIVVIDGEPAKEYDNDDDTEPDSGSLVTKYVEVVSGKEFLFRVLIKPNFKWGEADIVTARYSIDGRRDFSGIVMKMSKFRPLYGMSGEITGEWSGSGDNAQHHKLVFVDLETRQYKVAVLEVTR